MAKKQEKAKAVVVRREIIEQVIPLMRNETFSQKRARQKVQRCTKVLPWVVNTTAGSTKITRRCLKKCAPGSKFCRECGRG